MGLALPFSYIPAVCLLYGLTVGLGEHVKNVSKADLKKFNIVSNTSHQRQQHLLTFFQVSIHSSARKSAVSLLCQILDLGSLRPPFQNADIQTSRLRCLVIHRSMGCLGISKQLVPMHSSFLFLG
jgi:hypothetical protein